MRKQTHRFSSCLTKVAVVSLDVICLQYKHASSNATVIHRGASLCVLSECVDQMRFFIHIHRSRNMVDKWQKLSRNSLFCITLKQIKQVVIK